MGIIKAPFNQVARRGYDYEKNVLASCLKSLAVKLCFLSRFHSSPHFRFLLLWTSTVINVAEVGIQMSGEEMAELLKAFSLYEGAPTAVTHGS